MTMHDWRRYQQGCRCAECKASQSEYRRDLKQRKTRLALAAPPDGPGRVEAAVMAEVEALGVDRPGSVESLLAMARLIDDPGKWSQHSSADRRLQAGLAELRSVSGVRGRRLASVQKMSARVG